MNVSSLSEFELDRQPIYTHIQQEIIKKVTYKIENSTLR